MSQTVSFDFKGQPHWFTVEYFATEEALREKLGLDKVTDNVTDDTIAYTDSWSNKESVERNVEDQGNLVDCCGRMYLPIDADHDTLAHEATHMALGILERMGETTMPITTAAAPPVEEELCELVGFIAQELHALTSANVS